MKETIKTSRTAGYLEKIFRKVNEKYFNNELEEPIITIQSTPKAYGHVTVDKRWKKGSEEFRHELNIGAGTLDRDIEYVVSTMIHECVHLYCLQKGIQDTSRGGTYHNKKFRDEAEKRDLKIDHHEKYGWTITSPTDNLLEWILKEEFTEIKMNRFDYVPSDFSTKKPVGGVGGTPTTGKSNTRKYQCPCCKMSVRATKDLTDKLQCVDCQTTMIEV